MVTYERPTQFMHDFKRLTLEQRERFLRTVLDQFVVDLNGDGFRPGLRVKRVQATAGMWEMTWAPNGRATFSYGPELRPGEPHIVWHRVGTHDIFPGHR